MAADSSSSSPIKSEFASDPDMADLVAEFVGELGSRTQSLQEALSQSKFADLQRLSHQLKGACGGYGFPSLGEAAAKLEASLKKNASEPQAAALDDISRQVNELVDLCRRATT
ncbi:MAG: Hpt domain-containing protein [Planctomycetota bacterium]|jgi:HPt (histidine-containing phosphotransfer) domain-containing protein|nr:Hpt domain-containing protein [Planctomycetota bacterium]